MRGPRLTPPCRIHHVRIPYVEREQGVAQDHVEEWTPNRIAQAMVAEARPHLQLPQESISTLAGITRPGQGINFHLR